MAEETLPTPRTRKPRTKTVVATVPDGVQVETQPKPRTRRASVKKVNAPDEVDVVPARPTRARTRKAPTPIAEQKVVKQKSRTLRYVSIGLFIVALGASAAIGFSAEGEINVSTSIAAQLANSPTKENGEPVLVAVPPASQQVIDSGLIASGDQSTVTPPPVATSTEETASSTDATASSTETVSDDVSGTASSEGGAVAGASTDTTENTEADQETTDTTLQP